MKKLFLIGCLLSLVCSLSAQETDFRHSISLNFNGGFPQRFNTITPQEIFRKWIPGLEYRFRLNERVQLRAGFKYSAPQTWAIGNPSTGFFSSNIAQGIHSSLGGQVHFWPSSYLQNFQTYAFIDLGMGFSEQERYVFNPANTPVEQNSESVNRQIGINWGLGLAYQLGKRWVFRFETAYAVNWNAYEAITGPVQLQLQNPPRINGNSIRFFSHSFVPISEVSIGWRF